MKSDTLHIAQDEQNLRHTPWRNGR